MPVSRKRKNRGKGKGAKLRRKLRQEHNARVRETMRESYNDLSAATLLIVASRMKGK